MNIVLKLGERLREVRISSGIKQKDLAVHLGIQAPLLSMYEQGKREPSLTFLSEFTKFFNITLCHLFSKIDEDFISVKTEKTFESLLLEMKDLIVHLEEAAQGGKIEQN